MWTVCPLWFTLEPWLPAPSFREGSSMLLRSCALLLLAGLASSAPPVVRLDAHGDPLPDAAVGRLGTTRWQAGMYVIAMTFSPDGQLVAMAGDDGAVRLWEASSGKLVRALWGHR